MSRVLRASYVRVLSEATIAAIGATPAERRAAVRADLEAALLAQSQQREDEEARAIQAEFGFDQLEPVAPHLQQLPDCVAIEREQPAIPYYLRHG